MMWRRWIAARRRETLYRTGIFDQPPALPPIAAATAATTGSAGAA